MGQVLNASDFAAAQAIRAAKLNELGFAPICMAPAEENEGHSHTLVEEIVIVQSGEGKIQIENETYDLCAGSVASGAVSCALQYGQRQLRSRHHLQQQRQP